MVIWFTACLISALLLKRHGGRGRGEGGGMVGKY